MKIRIKSGSILQNVGDKVSQQNNNSTKRELDSMIFQFDHFEIDTKNFTLSIDGKPISVEPLVFNVIAFLVQNRDKLVSREEIFNEIWPDRVVSETALSNHIKSARKTLGDDGSRQKYIKTIHGRGYQFVGDARELNNNKIAVLPFSNLKPSQDTDYFGYSIADQIIGQLCFLQGLNVLPAAMVHQFENSSKEPSVIGSELDVNYLLIGNYFVENGVIRLNIELIQLDRNKTNWRESIQIAFQDVFQLQDKIASKVAFELNLQFTQQDQSHFIKDVSKNPLAYEYFLRSISYPNGNEGHKLAIEMLEKSIVLDPEYSPAYVMLGRHKRLLEQHGRIAVSGSNDAEGYYLKALSLNPYSLLALSNLADLYSETYQYEKAVELIHKMLEINADSADAHFSLGYIYRYTGMLEESIQEMELALSIKPREPRFRSIVASCFCAGQYKKALKWIHLDKGSDYAHGWHGIISYYDSDYSTSQKEFAIALEKDPYGVFGLLAKIFKGFMENDKGQVLTAIKNANKATIIDSENVCFDAMFHAEIEESETSLALLKKAVDAGYFSYPFIKENASFKKLAALPEFKKMLKNIKQKHLAFKKHILNT